VRSERIIASVEARMDASRLPGKMAMDIHGQPALARVFERLKQCELLDGIILATTISEKDDALVGLAAEMDIPVFRGSEEDVLQRVVDAQRKMESDVIVEICGDCPLIDPEIVDLAIETYLFNDCDVVTSGVKQSYPQGTEVQVFSFSALSDVEKRINDPAVREHVSLYFYENADTYKIHHLIAPRKLQVPSLRLQLDYKEDLDLIRAVYERLEPKFGGCFGVDEIIKLFDMEPSLRDINSSCEEKSPR